MGDDHEDGMMDYGFEDPMDREEESGNPRELKEFEAEFMDADDDEDEEDDN